MKKSTKIVGVSIGVLLLLIGAFFMFAPKSQTAIGYAATQADCTSRMKDQWCVEGYSCTACQQYTLSYYIQFSSGSTNKVWTSDCVYGTTPSDSAHVACQATSNIVSHVKWHCYNGNVYWYNSAGTREDIKASCSNGCTDTTLDSANCNAGSTPTPTGQKFCMPGTNYLCTSGTYNSNDNGYYCDIDSKTYCAYGCANNACKAQSCTNTCDTQGYVDCESATSRKICGVFDKAPCLSWKGGYGCANNQECNAGKCVDKPDILPDPTPDEPTICTSCDQTNCEIPAGLCGNPDPQPAPECLDAGVTTCVSKYTYQKCNADGTLGSLKQCADGTSCDSGKCVAIDTVTPPPNVDACANMKCEDYCDKDGGSHTDGSCTLGECVYNRGEINSPTCLDTTKDTSGLPKIFWIGLGIIILGGIIATIFVLGKAKKN